MSIPGVPQGVIWPEGWPAPNYIDPPTRGFPGLFIITFATTASVVALRLYSRLHLTRSAGMDDVFLVAGFIFSLGQTYASYMNLTAWGWNKHLWDVPFNDLEHVRLGAWLLEIFYLGSIGCTKISILLVYRRISNGSSNKWFIRLIWVAIVFTATYVVALALELFLVCDPLEAYWKSFDPNYTRPFRCGDERVPLLLSVVLNVVSDIYTTVLPIFLARKLQISKKQRIGLSILFSFGVLTICTGGVRIYFLDIVTINYKPGPHTHDVTWAGWPLYAWTDVEAHMAIICASAPALRILFIQKLKSPLAHLFNASRYNLSRSLSRSRSSSKPLTSRPCFRARPSGRTNTSSHNTRTARRFDIEIIHNPSPSQTEIHKRDIEKFPMEQILRLGPDSDKLLPLPPTRCSSWAASSTPSPGLPKTWRPSSLTWSSHALPSRAGSVEVSRASSGSGEFLPIYMPAPLRGNRNDMNTGKPVDWPWPDFGWRREG